jgi:hypothetical protein
VRVVILTLLATSLAGCSTTGVTPPAQRDVDQHLAKMRKAEQPFYFAGREFEGLPLTAAAYEYWHDGGFFAYGTCTIPPGQDGGCAPPIEIQIFRFDAGQWKLAVGCHRKPSLLGVPTVRHDGLVLVSEGALVKIYARNAARDRRVALALRSVDDPARPIHRLPPPSRKVRAALSSVCR